MSSEIDERQAQPTFGSHCHPACIVCGTQNKGSMRLAFEDWEDGGVKATFACDAGYQGYPGRLHGGVIAMLLDAAMTHCLFARQIRAVTARLSIRYRLPVELGKKATVQARITRETRPLFGLYAEIVQAGQIRAAAEAKFLEESSQALSEPAGIGGMNDS